MAGPIRFDGPRTATPPARATQEPPRVTQWKNGLLDLSLRNRLINFTERSALAVVLPDGSLGHVEDLLHQGASIHLRANDEFAAVERERGIRSARDLPQQQLAELLHTRRTVHVDVSTDAYPDRLRNLAYKARTIIEETGANNLYLALGTLEWQFDTRTLRSPLILVPILLAAGRRGGHYQIALDEAGMSTPNYCLIEKLRQVHGLEIPGLTEPITDDAGVDLDAALDATRRAIAERGLPFRVEATAHLSILQFAKFRLWKDLDENWVELARNPLVAHLVHTPTDEASQVRVADAIGAMGRARSVVVVGDSLQMPPTSFAESGISDEFTADAVEDEESILTECVQARVARQRLSWHYRSRDEALIAFSNQMYYDGGLSTFPAPTSDEQAISLVRVDGHFHRSGKGALLRTNPEEARAVVAEIGRRFAESPDRSPSIGVVTFNQQQRTFIEGLLRDADDPRLTDALDDPDGLFVKNLENVQGDERDVVLFSTAFSVNDKGVLPLNFGPLNRVGGERRLNVAVTRARRQVIVFSSFDPAQMRTGETSSVGVRHLRTYLEVAARGPAVLPQDRRAATVPDRHRDDIAAVLRDRGIDVTTGVGLSDFTIDLVLARDGHSRVAVLLDGPGWARRLTAGDRDVLPHEVLGRILDWPAVDRVWLPDWLADRDAVADRLADSLEKASTTTAEDGQDASPAPAPSPELVDDEPARPYPAAPVAARLDDRHACGRGRRGRDGS